MRAADTGMQVAAAARAQPATVYADAVLREAAALLADLYAAGDGHGIGPGDWDGLGADLPGLALRAVAGRHRRARSASRVRAGRERMAEALAAAGIAPVGVYQGRLVLPRLAATPPWGWSGEAALTVGCYAGDGGWTLELAQERTPVIDVVAPSETAVAELVADVLTGRRADPPLRSFRR